MSNKSKNKLTALQSDTLFVILKARFEGNMNRHEGVRWEEVEASLHRSPAKLWSINEMEQTGGEPDVLGHDRAASHFAFYDCSLQTPKGRTGICYDREGLESRKEHKPASNAVDMAAAMGIELLDEEQYRFLQSFGEFDTKTSSWLKTPLEVRKLGGAIFGDCRYKRVFIYHNGAQSYYGVRGFRGTLSV
jgi:hypothetical protein